MKQKKKKKKVLFLFPFRLKRRIKRETKKSVLKTDRIVGVEQDLLLRKKNEEEKF